MDNQAPPINLISEFLTESEIKEAINVENLQLTVLSSDEDTRTLEPAVLSAIITACAGFLGSITTLIVNSVLKKYKDTKPNGLIIFKNEDTEIHIPFNTTSEDLKKKLEIVNELKNIDQTYITKIDG